MLRFKRLNEHEFPKIFESVLKGEPILHKELKMLLDKGKVDFEFIKLNGDRREAIGTRKIKLIPKRKHPNGRKPVSPKIVPFFDLRKKEWRSVSYRTNDIVKVPKKTKKDETNTITVTEKE